MIILHAMLSLSTTIFLICVLYYPYRSAVHCLTVGRESEIDLSSDYTKPHSLCSTKADKARYA
jgi:hypothetical protein